jgi:hypothetical protein
MAEGRKYARSLSFHENTGYCKVTESRENPSKHNYVPFIYRTTCFDRLGHLEVQNSYFSKHIEEGIKIYKM